MEALTAEIEELKKARQADNREMKALRKILYDQPASPRVVKDTEKKLASLEKRLAKTEADIERKTASMKNKEGQIKNILTKRSYIPLDFPDFETALASKPIIEIEGFKRLDQEEDQEKLLEALLPNNTKKILVGLSEAFECDLSQVLLYEPKTIKREGKDTDVLYVWYHYNPDFNDVLAQKLGGKFDFHKKSWNIPNTPDAIASLTEYVKSYFSVVIDLQGGIIQKNEAQSSRDYKAMVAMKPIPYHESVSRAEIEAEVAKIQVDNPEPVTLFINNGKAFVPYPEQDQIFTTLPFLLLRIQADKKSPKYISYSVLGRCAEDVQSHNGKEMKRMLARFFDAFRILGQEAYTENKSAIIQKSDEAQAEYHGFLKFRDDVERARDRIPDLDFSLLCSDYTSLVATGYGADSNAHDVKAHVILSRPEYIERIAQYFGYSEKSYPLIFTREYLDSFNPEKDRLFSFSLSHMLAYWLACAKGYESHGPEWSIYNDILSIAYAPESFSSTIYRHYQPDKLADIQWIEKIIEGVAIRVIKDISAKRPFTENDIHALAQACIKLFNER